MLGFVGILALAFNLAGDSEGSKVVQVEVDISSIDEGELERFREGLKEEEEEPTAYELAVEQMETRLAEQPDNRFLLEELAVLHYNNGDLAKALENFEAALMLDPENVMLEFRRATVLHLLDRFEESVAGFTRVIEGDPELAEAFFYRAHSHFDKGDKHAAEEDMSEFVAMSDSEELKSHGKELLRHWKSVQ